MRPCGGPLPYGRGSELAAYGRNSLQRSHLRTATVRERATSTTRPDFLTTSQRAGQQ